MGEQTGASIMVVHPKSDIGSGGGGDRTSQRCGACAIGTEGRTHRLARGLEEEESRMTLGLG